MSITLGEIARQLNGHLRGDAACEVRSIATLAAAGAGDISFLSNSRYRKYLQETSASAVLVRDEDAEFCPVNAIIVTDPYVAYARVTALLNPMPVHAGGVHASAVVGDQCSVHESAWIGPHCVIEDGAEIGPGVQLGAGCFVGAGSKIGRDSRLMANVTIYHQCVIGARAIIHSGAVIGSDGFGFANERGTWIKIPQIGRVIIGNDVEIGANTAIDRGALEDTVIEDGVKLDNMVQIAHNVHIGAHTVMAGQSGVAGSGTVGRHCAIGGQAGVVGHIKICDNVTITGRSMVSKSISEPGVYSAAIPVETNQDWNKTVARLRQLDRLVKRIRELEQQLDKK